MSKDLTPTESPEILAELQEVYRNIMLRAPEHDIDPTLDRVAKVLDLLGSPERNYRVVHITGTNGKTSTSRMVERLVREHGLRTGRFTSPHLASVTERIAIDGEPISAQNFIDTYRDVAPYVEMVDADSQAVGGPRLSFFEVLTVMAYVAFSDAPIDVAVIEVGLGGRWDSTNVADGDIAILTPIAIDHAKYLGTTVQAIAREKAGIIKPGAIAITAVQQPEALAEIAARANEVGARVIREGISQADADADADGWENTGYDSAAYEPGDIEVLHRLPAVGGQLLSLRTPAGVYEGIYIPLFGAYQAHNALLALTAVESLLAAGGALSAGIVETAFAGVDAPGRLEVVRSGPTIIVDSTHNPAGAAATVSALEESFAFERLIGVIGIMADKDAEGILVAFESAFAEVVITSSASDRAADAEELAIIAREIFGEEHVHVHERLDDALEAAVTLAEQEDPTGMGTGAGVFVAGSVLLAAEARVLLGKKPRR